MRRRAVLTALLLALPAPALAQAAGHAGHAASQPHTPDGAQIRRMGRPDGWQVRYDRADAVDSTLAFTAMAPGWHLTTGPSAILYEPGKTATGVFRAEAELYLFPGERNEGFGVFVGGADLAGDAQRYTYFLLRRDGRFLVKRRDGAATRELLPWTEHAAIPRHDRPEGTVKYVLAVDAGRDTVRFLVDGAEVAALPRGVVAPDGIVGLRVNHALNLHVTSLDVKAP